MPGTCRRAAHCLGDGGGGEANEARRSIRVAYGYTYALHKGPDHRGALRRTSLPSRPAPSPPSRVSTLPTRYLLIIYCVVSVGCLFYLLYTCSATAPCATKRHGFTSTF